MKNRVYDALTEIKAEEQLKQNTLAFLQKQVYQKRKKHTAQRLSVTFASLAIAVFAVVFSCNLYFTESAYMDIDVNPGIELTLNRFDRVIGAYAYNEDGRDVLDAVDIRHNSYEDALTKIIEKMSSLGYLKSSGLFTATLQAKDIDAERENLTAMRSCIDSALQAYDQSIEQNIFSVDSATKIHAHEQNLTPAKYLAILELQELDPSVTFNGCRNHSISDIKQQTKCHMNGGFGQSPYSRQNMDSGYRDNEGEHFNDNNANNQRRASSGDQKGQSEHSGGNSAAQSPPGVMHQNGNNEHDDGKNKHGHRKW